MSLARWFQLTIVSQLRVAIVLTLEERLLNERSKINYLLHDVMLAICGTIVIGYLLHDLALAAKGGRPGPGAFRRGGGPGTDLHGGAPPRLVGPFPLGHEHWESMEH